MPNAFVAFALTANEEVDRLASSDCVMKMVFKTLSSAAASTDSDDERGDDNEDIIERPRPPLNRTRLTSVRGAPAHNEIVDGAGMAIKSFGGCMGVSMTADPQIDSPSASTILLGEIKLNIAPGNTSDC